MTEYLYLIKCSNENEDFFKIGIAVNPMERIASLQTGNPFPLFLMAAYGFENAQIIERSLHQRFDNCRKRGEWFNLSDEDLYTFAQLCRLLGGVRMGDDNGIGVSEAEIEEAEEIDDSLDDVRTELRMLNGEPRGVVLMTKTMPKKVIRYIGKRDEDFDKYLELYKEEHPDSKVFRPE